MGGGFFDEFGLGGLRFGEVEAGDLEAVEEEAGATGVDVVGGDALEDLADGVLDGGSVFGEGISKVERRTWRVRGWGAGLRVVWW